MNTVLFAGYPKSGNTLIAHSINLAGNVKNPDIYILKQSGKDPSVNPIFKEEVCSIKTHDHWDPNLNIHDLYYGKVLKVIVINRNPFDTLLSGINYFRIIYKINGLKNDFQKRSLNKLFPEFKVNDNFLENFTLENLKTQGKLDIALNRFSEDGTSFLNFYRMSGTWSAFASSYEYSGLPTLKIRYEDLEKISIDSFNGEGATNPYLLKISSFLEVDHENLAKGFALQRSNAFQEKNNTQAQVKFMNKMTSGYWKDYLSLKTCKSFVRKNYHAMLINGYEDLVEELL